MKNGSIIEIEYPGSASVAAGEVCQMLVQSHDDDTVTGTVFLPNGRTEYMTLDKPEKASKSKSKEKDDDENDNGKAK